MNASNAIRFCDPCLLQATTMPGHPCMAASMQLSFGYASKPPKFVCPQAHVSQRYYTVPHPTIFTFESLTLLIYQTKDAKRRFIHVWHVHPNHSWLVCRRRFNHFSYCCTFVSFNRDEISTQWYKAFRLARFCHGDMLHVNMFFRHRIECLMQRLQ